MQGQVQNYQPKPHYQALVFEKCHLSLFKQLILEQNIVME